MGDCGLEWGEVGKPSTPPQMLLGEYEHTIDDKNRLTLPARFRESFREGVIVTRGMDRCLTVYPPAKWEGLVESTLGPLSPLSPEARRLERYFYSAATEAEIDKQGRIMIPAALAEYAELGRDVVVAGLRDHLEVWNREAWRRERELVEGSAEDVAERLAGRRD